MGKYRFERADFVQGSRYNVIEFDSSPSGSICRMYGYAPQGFELREVGRKSDQEIYYEVWASHRTGGTPEEPVLGRKARRGKLRMWTDAAILERFG
jgi:hypothetical protein